MKIGILTFHSAHNYGAVLQAFALQRVLEKLNYDVEFIDYRPPFLIQQAILPVLNGRSPKLKAKLIAEGLLSYKWRVKRRQGFENFINSKLHLSQEKYGDKPFSSSMEYDAFVMGSDQIWNIKLTKGFNKVYWGDFDTKKEAKKISYAASMSNYDLKEDERIEMLEYLKKFNSISVREEEAKHFILDNFNIEPNVVLDPTFLLDKTNWKIISKKPAIKEKYILVYTISLKDEVLHMAKLMAQKTGFKIIELTATVDKKAMLNNYQAASPEEYLGLFENAEIVLTSSFHGLAFSVIFNKQFYSIGTGTDKDSRQKSILNNLGLMDRFITAKGRISDEKIDYNKVNSKLDELRKMSINFLEKSLLKP